MSCSCCQPATLPQPNESPSDATTQIDVGQAPSEVNDVVSAVRGNPGAAEANSLDMTVEDGCDMDDAQPDTSCQDDCCGSVSANTKIEDVGNDNSHSLPSIKYSANASCDDNSSGPSKQKTGPEACGGSCCDDQPAETFCNTDVSPPGDLTGGYCKKGLIIEASEGKSDTCLRAHLPKRCSNTLSSSTSAPTESKAPECCSGIPAPCCNEPCLDRLALRECNTWTETPQVETTQQGTLTEVSVSYVGHY